MPRSFKNIRLSPGMTKDPRFVARVVLGLLLLANLVAAYFVFRPLGGSAEELDQQLAAMRQDVQQRQAAVQRMRMLVSKMDHARTGSDEFLSKYFMNRQTAASTIVSELDGAAKESGIRPKGTTFVIDPIEGSATLDIMTISASYEGTYGDLLEFVNKLDKSPRFLILDSLTATPLQGSGNLNVSLKLNTFVREDGPLS